MASYVLIELDTSPPLIEIYAPGYTTKDIVNQISIVSDEELDNTHEVYSEDSTGEVRHYTFHKTAPNTFTGLIRFSNALGIVTVYARVKDTVGNFSNVVSKSIEIKESLNLLTMEVSEHARELNTVDKCTEPHISSQTRNVEVSYE